MKTIDLRELKAKAFSFPEPARTLILTEADTLQVEEFLAKVSMWERILQIKGGN